jgi:hypothetical protein
LSALLADDLSLPHSIARPADLEIGECEPHGPPAGLETCATTAAAGGCVPDNSSQFINRYSPYATFALKNGHSPPGIIGAT